MKAIKVLAVILGVGIVGVAFAAAGPPVPNSWYRAGNVSLGQLLYFTNISSSLTAVAGGAQGASALPAGQAEVTRIGTVASSNDSTTLSCTADGQTQFIQNAAASNATKVFAISPGKINGIATNTGYSLAAGKAALCLAVATTATANACDWLCVGP